MQGIMLCLTMFKMCSWSPTDVLSFTPDLLSVLKRDAWLVFIAVHGPLFQVLFNMCKIADIL